MALGDSYITTEELAAYLGVSDSDADLLLDSSTSAATEWVEQYTQRQFNNTQTATPGRSCHGTSVLCTSTTSTQAPV